MVCVFSLRARAGLAVASPSRVGIAVRRARRINRSKPVISLARRRQRQDPPAWWTSVRTSRSSPHRQARRETSSRRLRAASRRRRGLRPRARRSSWRTPRLERALRDLPGAPCGNRVRRGRRTNRHVGSGVVVWRGRCVETSGETHANLMAMPALSHTASQACGPADQLCQRAHGAAPVDEGVVARAIGRAHTGSRPSPLTPPPLPTNKTHSG